jgi:hypothetical protein
MSSSHQQKTRTDPSFETLCFLVILKHWMVDKVQRPSAYESIIFNKNKAENNRKNEENKKEREYLRRK